MARVKKIYLESIWRNITQKKSFDNIGSNLLNLYGLGLGITCNYYIYDVSTKNK
jgi:hypothetical protein